MAANDNPSFEALTLNLGGEVFAIDANCVHEILDMIPQTDVPGAHPFVDRLINVRGKVVPLADLRIKFEMERTPRPSTPGSSSSKSCWTMSRRWSGCWPTRCMR